VTGIDGEEVGRVLADERHRLERLVDDLRRDLEAVIDASADANADDEHDPEGSTIGFERAQVASLLDQARSRLADVDRATTRLAAGAYGRCERCGGRVGRERLAAHPTAATCVGCASTPPGRLPGR
jgi:DnaK suppressor protein